MYSEDDLIPISALQHAMFCERVHRSFLECFAHKVDGAVRREV
jgi:hypothetical protein